MNRAETKAASERQAFRQFAALMEESDVWLSVESRAPPEPDLLCTHQTRGQVAFELVAITDPLIAKVNAGFGTSETGSYRTSDPTERIIRKKLGRHYETANPIELLVYNDLLVITPDDQIVEVVNRWLGSKKHRFIHAWFMGEFHARRIWSAPQ